ncbi:DUF4232 domain-containing protein [Streptomyces sp. NPDC059009]|uniref:DUF4232 domain-containing protein n=1 Tax=Streptomyces sp. NPDC059009 TaxID=3346694 RepID=UPI0036882D2A
MRARKLTFAALAVAAGLSLAACNGDDTAQSDPSAAPTKASSGGGSGSGGSDQGGGKDSGGKDTAGQNSGGQGTGSGGSGASDKCRTDDLDITASDYTAGGGEHEGAVAVTMKNHAGRDCVLAGYAGVDLKTGDGALSAQRSGEKSTPVTLKDGESVSFGVTYPLNESGGSGVSVTGIVVTPPNETKSFTLAWPGAKTLPATDGSGSPVQVGPMGSAGQGGAQ